MKRFFAAIVLFMMVGMAMMAVERSTRNVDIKDFEELVVKGSTEVVFTQGKKASVRIEGAKDNVDLVVVEQEGKVLKISQKPTERSYTGMKGLFRAIKDGVKGEFELVVYVTSPNLTDLVLEGAGNVKVRGILDTDNLEVTIKGSGDVDFEQVICDRVNAYLQGSGDVEFKSIEAVAATYSIKGSGDVKARQLKVSKTTLEIYGSGDMDVECRECGDVDATITGSGDIHVHGQIKNVSKNIRGSGRISVN